LASTRGAADFDVGRTRQRLAGFPMMFGWLAFLPYLLIASYVVVGLTVALYRTFFS